MFVDHRPEVSSQSVVNIRIIGDSMFILQDRDDHYHTTIIQLMSVCNSNMKTDCIIDAMMS